MDTLLQLWLGKFGYIYFLLILKPIQSYTSKIKKKEYYTQIFGHSNNKIDLNEVIYYAWF